MLTRFAYRINLSLERYFPEQRLFLKSDSETRFIRLRPLTQAITAVVASLALGWMIFATAILLMDSIGAGSSREQILRQQAMFEERLRSLSDDRDLRIAEASSAQERFNLALTQVSDMQARLLASEDRRRELETGIDVIQNTLRRSIKERDVARAEMARLTLAEATGTGAANTEAGRVKDTETTLDVLAMSLADTARQRDMLQAAADRAALRTEDIARQKRDLEARNNVIFEQLEQALTVSVEPLEQMFRDAGLNPDDLLQSVRSGYSGQGGPLMPISLSTKGAVASPEEARANAILRGLDEMNLYRIAAFKTPFGMPVKSAVRYTSGFGYRSDPMGRGRRMHDGQDFAGDYGTAVFATADGTVSYASWDSGYGRLIRIQHAYGIETRFAHLSQIRVEVGQKVSRGDRIGDMGNSGRSTGTHLHYEIRIGGSAINPMIFIKAASNVF